MTKKFVSMFLVLVMCLSLSAPAFAADNSLSELESIANTYIVVTQTGEETVYSNLQEFYLEARKELPALSDLELAKFTMEYTEQSYEMLPDEMMLDILDGVEASVSRQIFVLKDDGTIEVLSNEEMEEILSNQISPYATWTSEDGYLQIDTNKIKDDKGPNGTPYTLSTSASWLKMPLNRHTDTLSISYTGVLDDSCAVFSSFREIGTCSNCGTQFRWMEVEEYGTSSDNSVPHYIQKSNFIELDFSQDMTIGTKIKLQDTICQHPLPGDPYTLANYASTTVMNLYLRFAVIVTDNGEAKASYAHTYVNAIINIAAKIVDGALSVVFSGAPAISYKKYTAASVTLLKN